MSSDSSMSTTADDDSTDQEDADLEARVDVLEGQMDWVRDHIVGRLDELEARIDNYDDMADEVAAIRAELDTLHDVSDGAASTPEKRRKALQKAMLARFEARQGAVTKDYQDVIETLEEHGHGEVYPAQAYQAMEDAGEYPGFQAGEIVRDGEPVRGIKLVPEEVPASLTPEEAVNEINNDSRGAAPGERGNVTED